MKDWFLQLDPRERVMVTVGAIVVVAALIVMIGVRPLAGGVARAEQQVDDKQVLLTELDALAERLGPGAARNGGAAPGDEQSLVLLVDRTTRAAGLAPYVKRNQPDGENIRLRFENAPFDGLLEWLATIRNEYGLVAVSANVDRSREPGRVNCNIVLTRAGRSCNRLAR